MNVPNNAFWQQAAAQVLVAAGGGVAILSGAKMGLIADNIPLTADTVIGDIPEPAYAGYARKSITWSAVYHDESGSWSFQGPSGLWQMSDGLTPTVVWGYFIQSGAVIPLLMWAELFVEGPQNLVTPFDGFNIVAELDFGPDGWGAGKLVL